MTRKLSIVIGLVVLGGGIACGPMVDETGPTGEAGKGDGPLGNTSNAYLARGVESNLPTAVVTKLTHALRQKWVKDSTPWYRSAGKDELRPVFSQDPELQREFGDLLAAKRWSDLRKVHQALLEMIHNPVALVQFGGLLSQGAYRQAYDQYVPVRPQLLDAADEIIRGTPGGLPTVVLNIPAERIQVFYNGLKYQDNKVVVGQLKYDGYDMNSKTRVGDHTIKEWIHCYSNADYPSWCNDKSNGAFGEWTAKLDRSYQYLHGTIGNGVLDWFAIRLASGSHGCVRNQNSDIERMQQIARAGSWVRKIYAVRERVMSAKKCDDDSTSCRDPFDQEREVTFRLVKHDNLYDYNTGNTGIYYPATGVTVDYAHPSDAMTSTVSGAAVAGPSQCDLRGGTCMKVVTCDGTATGSAPLGTPVPFLGCPGDSSVQCCVP